LTRLRADIDEQCWVGRHRLFVFCLGIPMLLVYVVGFPVCSFVVIYRRRQAKRTLGKKMRDVDGHQVWGMLYSSFREDAWFWGG
jgi:hypothetical protein